MHRTTIYLPDELHRSLRLLGYATRSGISDLLRAAAQTQYSELFSDAEKSVMRRQPPTSELRKLAAALGDERYHRDRRLRRNRPE